jgi:hypothetical protein
MGCVQTENTCATFSACFMSHEKPRVSTDEMNLGKLIQHPRCLQLCSISCGYGLKGENKTAATASKGQKI